MRKACLLTALSLTLGAVSCSQVPQHSPTTQVRAQTDLARSCAEQGIWEALNSTNGYPSVTLTNGGTLSQLPYAAAVTYADECLNSAAGQRAVDQLLGH